MSKKKNGLGVPRPKKSGSGSPSKSSPKKAPGFPSDPSREMLGSGKKVWAIFQPNGGLFGYQFFTARSAAEFEMVWEAPGSDVRATSLYARGWKIMRVEIRAFALGIGVAATKERVGNPTGAKRSNAKPGASRATPKKKK